MVTDRLADQRLKVLQWLVRETWATACWTSIRWRRRSTWQHQQHHSSIALTCLLLCMEECSVLLLNITNASKSGQTIQVKATTRSRFASVIFLCDTLCRIKQAVVTTNAHFHFSHFSHFWHYMHAGRAIIADRLIPALWRRSGSKFGSEKCVSNVIYPS